MKTDHKTNKIVKEYLQNEIIGSGCYIKDGSLVHWTSWPHGSGTTTEKGKASEIQVCASQLLKLLTKEDEEKETQISESRSKKLADIIKKEKEYAERSGGQPLTEEELALKLVQNHNFKNMIEFRD